MTFSRGRWESETRSQEKMICIITIIISIIIGYLDIYKKKSNV